MAEDLKAGKISSATSTLFLFEPFTSEPHLQR